MSREDQGPATRRWMLGNGAAMQYRFAWCDFGCCGWQGAAITDEPPPEVAAAAGHDRSIVPIKPENIDAWLIPNASNLEAMYAILDDREHLYYVHRLAA
jgi:hypothetical protein